MYKIVILLLIPFSLHAQIKKCGDTWTNNSCDKEVEVVLKEKPFDVLKEEYRESSLKRTLLHDFTTERLNARKNHSVQLSVKYLEEICTNKKNTLKECQEEIGKQQNLLLEKIKVAQDEQSETESKEKSSAQSNESTVVINDNDTLWLRQQQININSQGVQAGITNVSPRERRIERVPVRKRPSLSSFSNEKEIVRTPGLNRR